ncbi:MAG: DUF1365 family protein [Aliidongia sp.]
MNLCGMRSPIRRSWWACLSRNSTKLPPAFRFSGIIDSASARFETATISALNPDSLSERLARSLAPAGFSPDDFSSIQLITVPRVLGLGFNPLSLFICLDQAGGIQTVVAEVHNTFGEVEVYVLGDAERVGKTAEPVRFRFPKTLFVSPFNGVEGQYDLKIGAIGTRIDLDLALRVRDRTVIQTALHLMGEPLTTGALARTLLKHPLTAALALPRIAHQALILRYVKGLKPRLKPNPRRRGATASAAVGSEPSTQLSREYDRQRD